MLAHIHALYWLQEEMSSSLQTTPAILFQKYVSYLSKITHLFSSIVLAYIGLLRATVLKTMKQSTSLVVTWELLSPTETIPTYTISYSNTNNTDCFTDSDVITDITAMQYTLSNLQEATEYNVTVSTTLTNGRVERDSLTTTTLARIYVYILYVHIVY